MGTMIKYTPEQVTTALMACVANGGNVAKTADQLIEDEYQVPVETLRRWKTDTHAEQYRRLEEKYGAELEAQAIMRARQLIEKASEIEEGLLEKNRDPSPELAPQALRAVADSRAKATNALLQLTGRPVNPKGEDQADVVKAFTSLINKGFLRAAEGVTLTLPESSVQEEPPDK